MPQPISTFKEKENMQSMFDTIAHSYDFLNHFLSLSIDKKWRKRVVKLIPNVPNLNILDVSTGTGDMAICMAKRRDCKVLGVDISKKMLEIGIKKIKKQNLERKIELQQHDVANMPFGENIFDICTVAFGVRNFEFLEKGLQEMYRCLKPNGIIIVLEFSRPEKAPYKQLYSFYFTKVLPLVGKIISKNKTAYSYLPDSVANFPDVKSFLKLLSKCGFKNPTTNSMTFGTVTIYNAVK